LPCGHNFLHAIEEDGAENSALVQDLQYSTVLMFLLRNWHNLIAFSKQSSGFLENCKDELFENSLWEFFQKVSFGCVQFYLLFMRFAFWYKTDMHILTLFLANSRPGLHNFKEVSQIPHSNLTKIKSLNHEKFI